MKKLQGVTVAMVTPMKAGGEVDHDALKALTNFLIDRGVDGLYPCGTTGEMLHLTTRERMDIAQTVVEAAASRVTVYIHAGAMTYADTLTLVSHAQSVGADGAGVVTPAYFTASSRELENYYIQIARATPDFPVYLYNIPQCAANDLSAESVRRIHAACPNVIGIKYSYADMLRTMEYINAAEGFSVLQGADRLLLAALAVGCDGTVSGAASVYPEPFVAVYKAWQAGDVQAARQYQRAANLLAEVMQCGANMAYFKTALEARGIGGNHMRMPQLDLTDEQKAAFLAELKQAEAALPEGLLTP